MVIIRRNWLVLVVAITTSGVVSGQRYLEMWENAGSYPFQEIVDAFHHLHDADVKLKSTGQNAKLILESVLFKICGAINDRKTD